ncbi:GIY-YIG nuclease family protein [Hoeflea sp.]|uniref:GIY-YIG nuclease family protein n=1 Tax=Hoeflea sp. TaxID=1940281 RepID=UPI003B02C123
MADMSIEGDKYPNFPARQTITKRLGTEHERATAVLHWAERRCFEGRTVEIFRGRSKTRERRQLTPSMTGWIYLMKQGRYHKLGKTNDPVRPSKELGIQAAEETTQVHVIKTDDHDGIETYWKNRWKKLRHRGEFYKLPHREVVSFRRMKHF